MIWVFIFLYAIIWAGMSLFVMNEYRSEGVQNYGFSCWLGFCWPVVLVLICALVIFSKSSNFKIR